MQEMWEASELVNEARIVCDRTCNHKKYNGYGLILGAGGFWSYEIFCTVILV
jgi:hypothetical protein